MLKHLLAVLRTRVEDRRRYEKLLAVLERINLEDVDRMDAKHAIVGEIQLNG